MEKVRRKSLSVCLKKNSPNFISDGLKLLVWVTHKKFELDRWIQQLLIFKPRATVHCTLHSIQCTMYTVHSSLFTVHIVYLTMYAVPCTLYTVHCTLYTVQCKLNTLDITTGQTLQHRPAKMVFSSVLSNSDWQWTMELRAGWRGVPLSTDSSSYKQQLKIGLHWLLVWHLTFSGAGRMITCRRLNILCRVNTKGKWQIQQRMEQTLHHQLTKTVPINCAEQIQLTNMRAIEAPSRRRGASLASIFISWICKAQMIPGLCQLVMQR